MALNTYTTKVALRVLVAFRFFAAGMFFEAVYMLPRKWKRRVRTRAERMLDELLMKSLRYDYSTFRFFKPVVGRLSCSGSFRLPITFKP